MSSTSKLSDLPIRVCLAFVLLALFATCTVAQTQSPQSRSPAAQKRTASGSSTIRGGSVAGAGVVLLPVDQKKWGIRSVWGLARADAEGRFPMRMAPGEYLAVTWSVANEPTVSFQSYVRERSASARRFILQPGETKVLDIQTPATAKEHPQN